MDMNRLQEIIGSITVLFLIVAWPLSMRAQIPPSSGEISKYSGILAAAARGDTKRIEALIAKGEKPDARDGYGRTPLHVAAYGGHHEAMRVLVAAGADPNALENDRYDIVTIAAVANDVPSPP
jgi:ankyrin repeat protein